MIKKYLALTCTAAILMPFVSYATGKSQPDNSELTVVLLVNEQPEAIQALAQKHEATFSAFGQYDHPKYDDMAQIVFGLSFYPEMLEDGISREERLSSAEWKTLLAFLSEYEETDAQYIRLPNDEKLYLKLLTKHLLGLCKQAEVIQAESETE